MKEVRKPLITLSALVCAVLLLFIGYQFWKTIAHNFQSFYVPYYTESYYKTLENAYNNSQYRLKNPTSLIPDETVFSYAAGAYIRGINPIMINSETAPMGKYFIGLSILLFKNDKLIILFFAFITIIILAILSHSIIHNWMLALVPVALFASEKLFLNQIVFSPLNDVIQLPFVLLSLYFFGRELRLGNFLLTAFFIGIAASVKSVMTGGLLVTTFLIFLGLQRKINIFTKFIFYLSISLGIYFLTYIKVFLDGYSFNEFIGFQKWIILYQQSKLLFPLSAWKLVFFNEWQAWWGDMSILKADDWNITWPLFTSLALVLCAGILLKKIRVENKVNILVLWSVIYALFLSLGVISSRYLLPFLPVTYILGTYVVYQFYEKCIKAL